MATLDAAYHPDGGIERGHAAEHIHGFHVQPSIMPRVAPRPGPLPMPVLSRIGPQTHANPFLGQAASVTITSTADATVSDVHIAGPDGALKLLGVGGGQYEVPVSGRICVAWLGSDTPTWTWTPIRTDPGDR